MKLPVLIVHAPGTNRDREAAEAFRLAGAEPEVLTLSRLVENPLLISDFRLVCIPGGFSFGDALGAGRMLALHLSTYLGEALRRHLAKSRPILGICNGFQALLKAGFIGADTSAPQATLTHNARGQFECRWVTIVPSTRSTSPWLEALRSQREPGADITIRCPVAHGEGRVVAQPQATLYAAFHYVPADTLDGYPGNPNGSPDHLAGLTDETGLVLGLMPHPEDHIHAFQDPMRSRSPGQGSGLPLFAAGLAVASGASL